MTMSEKTEPKSMSQNRHICRPNSICIADLDRGIIEYNVFLYEFIIFVQ